MDSRYSWMSSDITCEEKGRRRAVFTSESAPNSNQILIETLVKDTVPVVSRISLARHKRMQLAQPGNSTTELQGLYSVVDQDTNECPFGQWEMFCPTLQLLNNHPCAEGDQIRRDPCS